jgi:hypothetical protein
MPGLPLRVIYPKGALGANCDIILPGPGMLLGFMSARHGLHNVGRNGGAGTNPTLHMTREHQMLTGAGWSYAQ